MFGILPGSMTASHTPSTADHTAPSARPEISLVDLIAIIGVVLHFFQPARLILISANMSNFGALIFPFMLMYMNSKLPKAARPKGWVYLILVLNFLFFGFFFLNFVWNEVTGDALVQF
jgi:TRAP-type C4-dicarboxylate transport system permease small subunit